MDHHLRERTRGLRAEPDARAAMPPAASRASPGPRRTIRRAARTAAGVLTVAGVLVGCTAGSDAPAASPTPTTSATSGPTPTAGEPAPAPTGTPAPTATEPVLPAPPATPADPAAPPPVSTPVHGATVWGVYLAMMTSEDDPAWVGSGVRLEQLGYEPGYGDISCDQGATETLGLPENVLVRWVHFDTREDAERFVALYGPDTLGMAQVTTLCLD